MVEYMGHSSATESSVPTPSSTTSTPVPLVPTPSPQESSLLMFDSDSERDILGEAMHQADIQFCPDGQDLFEGMMEEEDGVPAVSIP